MTQEHPCDTVKLWSHRSKRILILDPNRCHEIELYQETLRSMGHVVTSLSCVALSFVDIQTNCMASFDTQGPEVLISLSRDILWNQKIALWCKQQEIGWVGTPLATSKVHHAFAWHRYARSKKIPCIESVLLSQEMYGFAPLVYPHRVYPAFQRFQSQVLLYAEERQKEGIFSALAQSDGWQNQEGQTAQPLKRLDHPESHLGLLEPCLTSEIKTHFLDIKPLHLQSHDLHQSKEHFYDSFEPQAGFFPAAQSYEKDTSNPSMLVIESLVSEYEIHVPLLGKTPLTPVLCSAFSDPQPFLSSDSTLLDQIYTWSMGMIEQEANITLSVSVFQYDCSAQKMVFVEQDLCPDFGPQSPTAQALYHEGYTYSHLLAWLLEHIG